MLRDWGLVARNLKTLPTRNQYRHAGKYCTESFLKHFGKWSAIPARFIAFASRQPHWSDVLSLIQNNSQKPPMRRILHAPRTCHSKFNGRPTYGNQLDFHGLRHEPVNEAGVVFLFGLIAFKLGYMVEAIQTGFPDCEAKRQIAPGRWQRVRIEFEFESRNFRDHAHPVSGCDIIVCWRHNWPACPAQIEIVELSKLVQSPRMIKLEN
ncbi:MAG TPA: hypothetical protein VKJ65_14460 [Phycisphaerae bacterium]|nr:hypothetical protein [Phycisphaerae bacterium]